MLLIDFLNSYVENHTKGVRQNTIDCHYRPSIACFKRFLGKDPELSDLDPQLVNSWLKATLLSGKKKKTTVDNHRRAILTLWRAAREAGRITTTPDSVRRIGKDRIIVVAWTREELQQLIDHCEKLEGRMHGSELKRSDFFASLALAGYETGMRLGDLLSIERDWIRTESDGCGFITLIQSKTELQKSSKLSRETMLRIDRLMAQGPRRLIWSLNMRRESFYRQWREIVKGSGIRKGTFRWIRRSATTHVESQKPGCGYRLAGHADQRVTMQHYIDRTQLDTHVIAPIPLYESPLAAIQQAELRRVFDLLNVEAQRRVVEYARSLATGG